MTRTVLTRGVARKATEAVKNYMPLSAGRRGLRGGSGLFPTGRNQALLKCESFHWNCITAPRHWTLLVMTP